MRKEEADEKPPVSGKAPKAPTVRAIARRVGLSPATVSIALTGARPTGFVPASTRQVIWQAAREMGYPLEKLRSRRPPLEKVAVFAQRQTVFQGLILEICEHLHERSSQAVVHLESSAAAEVRLAQDIFRRGEINGIILVGSRSISTLRGLEDAPCVLVGEAAAESNTEEESPPLRTWAQAVADNVGGAHLAAEHLLSLGHRHAAVLIPSSFAPAATRRVTAFADAWRAAGQDFQESRDVLAVPHHDDGTLQGRLAAFWKSRERNGVPLPTALFCYNDWMAGQAIAALRSNALRVPGDVSIVGFDDAFYSGILYPPLTTVRQSFAAIAHAAADLLLERLHDPEAPPRSLYLPCTLIVRDSTAPPPSV